MLRAAIEIVNVDICRLDPIDSATLNASSIELLLKFGEALSTSDL